MVDARSPRRARSLPVRTAVRTGICLSLAGVTALYMASVAVHVAPMSAATYEIRKTTDPLLTPLFSQRWTLFAPNPPQSNLESWVQARYTDGAKRIRTTSWLGISGYLSSRSKQRPLAPSRLPRVARGLERRLATPLLRRDLDERRQFDPNSRSAPEIAAKVEALQRPYRELAVKLGTTVLRQVGPPMDKVVSVRVRMVATPIPSFADRNGGGGRERKLLWDSGWQEPGR